MNSHLHEQGLLNFAVFHQVTEQVDSVRLGCPGISIDQDVKYQLECLVDVLTMIQLENQGRKIL